MDKLIFTIDLDCFFASCEELRNKGVKGRPMAVANSINGRGVITTANYAARSYGINSGMPIFKAKKLYKNLIIIDPDFDYYRNKANEVFNIVMSYSNKVEIASIDECYADMTKLTVNKRPIEIAIMLSIEIFKKTGLIVSIGISTNIILSKMASNMDKPNGITTLYKHELPSKLWPLEINKMYMIGKATTLKFMNKGINTIGDLANLNKNSEDYFYLKKEIGINLNKYISSANGEYRDEISNETHLLKSMSKEKTLNISLIDINSIKNSIRPLFDFLIYRLKSRKLMTNNVSVVLKRDKTFKKISMNKKLKSFTDENSILWYSVITMLEELFKNNMSIKQIGLSFSGLKEKEKLYKQETLFRNNYKTSKDRLQELSEDIWIELNIDIVKGSTMKNNKKYQKNKQPLDNDSVKFKVWDK